jgi:hypothetical protein
MFFKELEQLRQEHPSLASLIAHVDDQLSQFDVSGLAKPAEFASFYNADVNQLIAIFDALVDSGLLAPVEMCECPQCHQVVSANDVKTRHATGDEFLCPDCGTGFLHESPRQFKVFRLSPRALHETTRNRMAPKPKVEHIVLLIHGILTDAVWQERVAAELNLLPRVEAHPIGYGFVELLMFWCPWFTRNIALRIIEKKVRLAISLSPGAKVSVIAHSFGTYCIFRLLNEKADLRFFRVILCGSIVSDRYPWDHVQLRVEETIINDCGTRDFWPAAAKSLTFGYGATGTFGFKSPGIRDRYHDFNHSGFFDEAFVRKYWVPFIATGEIVLSPWTSHRPSSPFLVKALATIPFQLVLLGCILVYFKSSIIALASMLLRLL